ncbi:hypothetical protein TruAng_012210 [Truncatella angustata]|nr:hypothetical protein TruAng_012210 [Truncatella angustata]
MLISNLFMLTIIQVFTETWDAHFTQDDGEVKTVPIKTVTLTYVDGTLANIPGTLATKTARDASYSAATGENPPETITNDDAEVSTFLTQTLTGAFQPAAVAKDHTSVSMWTETTTYTQTVAATTMNISGTPHTFTEWIQTITWTKLVTTHITVPDRIAYYTSPVLVDEPPFASKSHPPEIRLAKVPFTDSFLVQQLRPREPHVLTTWQALAVLAFLSSK